MRSGYSTVGHRAVGSRDVLEEEAWLGWDLSEEQSSGGGLALGGAVEAKSIMHRLLQGLPPTCHLSLSSRQELAHPQHSPWLLHLNLSGEEMPLGVELLGALVQGLYPGMGPSPHCVLLHVCKELLSHPSQPVGYLCAAFFVYLASTFSDCPPEFSLLIV